MYIICSKIEKTNYYHCLQRTRKEKKTYSEDWTYGDEEEIEGARSYSLQDKLDSDSFNESFVKQMDGKGKNLCKLHVFLMLIWHY